MRVRYETQNSDGLFTYVQKYMYIEIGLLLLLGAFKSLCPPLSSHHDTVTNFFCLFNYYYLFQAVPVNILNE